MRKKRLPRMFPLLRPKMKLAALQECYLKIPINLHIGASDVQDQTATDSSLAETHVGGPARANVICEEGCATTGGKRMCLYTRAERG